MVLLELLLPIGHRAFGFRQFHGRGLFGFRGSGQCRLHFGQGPGQFFDLRLVQNLVLFQILQRSLGFLEFCFLPFLQFAGVLNGLLQAGNIAAHGIKFALDFVESFAGVALVLVQFFKRCFSRALMGNAFL